MILARLVYVTRDEEWNPHSRICEEVEKRLKGLRLDTWNKEYVVTVQVEEVSRLIAEEDDE